MASAAEPRRTASNHPVVAKVERARRLAIRRVRLRGTAWGVCVGLTLLVGVGLLDYLLRQDDLGTRWFLSLLTAACLVVTVGWWVLPAWRWNPSLQQTAHRIEQFFPEMRDKISSALFFLQQEEADAAGSSPYFRRRHLHQMADVLSYTDIEAALNRRVAEKALYALVAVVAACLALLLLAPDTTTTAMARLAMPWRDISWPRQYNLILIDPPAVVPLGGRASIAVEDENGNLPNLVELQVRYESGGRIITHPMQMDQDANRMVYQLEAVQNPFEFRVRGGDDNTIAWRAVEVVRPPKFSDVQVTLIPPDYARWLPTQSPRSIIALEGTRLELRGKVDQPVVAAHVTVESQGKKSNYPLIVDADGHAYSTPSDSSQMPLLRANGSYWVEVTVESGLVKAEGQRHPVRVLPDRSPVVSWIEPTQNLTLTPQGEVDLSATVRDDLALCAVRLLARTASQPEPLLAETLLEGAIDRPLVSPPTNLATGEGETQTVNFPLDLAEIEGLQPGMVIELTVAAEDYLPQVGASLPRVITIISQEQLDQRVNRQQREIISRLSEARRLQQDARQQSRAVEIQLAEGSSLGPSELANLQNGEQNQKSVREKLIAGRDSAAAKIDALLKQLQQNRQEDHEAARVLEELRDKIEQIANAQLAPIESEITSLRRQLPRRPQAGPQNAGGEPSATEEAESDRLVEQDSAPSPSEETPPAGSASNSENREEPDAPAPGEVALEETPASQPAARAGTSAEEENHQNARDRLEEIGQRQEQVAGQLEDWQNELTRWDTFRRFSLDVRDLAQRQAELGQRVAEKQGETLGQDVERMSPEQRGSLKQMAEQQTSLASELDRIQGRMREMLQNGPESEEVANTLRDAIEENREAALSQRMRQAGQRIGQNQLSGAQQTQKQIASSLEEVLDTLQNRRETDKKELKRKLDQAQEELQRMQQRQKQLQRKADQAAAQDGQSQQQQKQLQELKQQSQALQQDAERMARKLERLSARQAAQQMKDVAQRLEEAARQAENLDTGQLQQEIEQAEKDLEEAQKELAKRQEQVEQDLAQEQAARLKQSIEQLVIRQTSVRDEVTRLDDLRRQTEDEQLTAAQQQTLRALSWEQSTLTEEIRSFADSIAKAEVFHLSLQLTAEVTIDLSRLLDAGELSPQTTTLANEAVERLVQLAEALEENRSDDGQEGQNQNQRDQGQQPQQAGATQDGISQTAQLRLLKMMQESLKNRTERVVERLAQQPDAREALGGDLSRLAAEQGRLSEMTLNLLPDAQEDLFDPDQLPELVPEQPDAPQQQEDSDDF